LEVKWWDWPEIRVRSLIPDLLSNDIEGFLSKADGMLQEEAKRSALGVDASLDV
jgi:hypothetical protein